MDDWNPLREDFVDEKFNSYIRGPAKGLVSKRSYTRDGKRPIQLYVTGIPNELEETGVYNLFSRYGLVTRAKKVISKKDIGSTFGFVTMASLTDAERAIRELDKFRIDRYTLRVSIALSEEERKKRADQKRFEDTLLDLDDMGGSDSEEPSGAAKLNGFGRPQEPPRNLQPVGRGQYLKDTKVPSLLATPGSAGAPTPGGYPYTVGPKGDNNARQPMTSTPSPSSKLHVEVNGTNSIEALNRDGYISDIQGCSRLHTIVGRGSPRDLYGDPSTSGYRSDAPSAGQTLGRGSHKNRFYKPEDYNMESGYMSDFTSNRNYSSAGRGYNDMNQSFRGSRGRGPGRRPWKNRGGMMGRGYPMAYPAPVYAPGVVYVDPYGVMAQQMNPMAQQMNPMAQQMNPMAQQMNPMAQQMNPHLLQPAYPNMMNPAQMAQQASPQQKKPKEEEEKGLTQECSVCSTLGCQRCSRCKTPYCSAKCQAQDWPTHKTICKALAKEAELAEAFESQFDLSVGEDLIPQVKNLMEKAIQEPIQVTLKKDAKKQGKKTSNDGSGSDIKTEKPTSNVKSGQKKDNTMRTGSDATKGKSCFNCGATDHIRNDCPHPANYRATCYKCNRVGHLLRDCPNERATCFNCNRVGHLSKDCPDEQGTMCFHCRGYGHISKECPEKGSDSAGNKYNVKKSDNPSRGQRGTSQPQEAPGKKGDQNETQQKGQQRSPTVAVTKSVNMSQRDPIPPKSKIAAKLPPQKKLSAAQMNVGDEAQIVITLVTNPDEMYIQIVNEKNIKPLADIMDTMAMKYPSVPCDVISVMVGEFYAAQFSQDQLWYRAQVKSLHGNDIVIQFVDFGNQETTSVDRLRQLETGMTSHPMQAVLCGLGGVSPAKGTQWSVSPQDLSKYLIADNVTYKAQCSKVLDRPLGKLHQVSLTDSAGQDVATQLIQAGLAVSRGSAGSPVISDSPLLVRNMMTVTSTLKVGEEIPVLITDKTSPITFTVQVPCIENIQAFLEFNAKFNQLYMQDKSTLYRPKQEGELVVSVFSGEEGWYRAEVKRLTDTSAVLLYVDYGNSETVPFTGLRRAEQFCSSLPLQGVPCRLADVEEPVSGWPQGIMELVEQNCEEHMVGVVRGIRDATVILELKTTAGKLLRDVLITRLEASASSGNVNERVESKKIVTSDVCRIETMKLTADGSPVDAVIMDVTSLDQFAIQLGAEEVQLELAAMMAELNQACVESTACDVEEGGYVAAQFSDGISTLWYRGLVMQKLSDKLKVYFIDYGNTDLVSKDAVTSLDEKFMTLSAIAINCSLKGCESKDALSQLKQLTNVVVKVETLACEQEKHIVSIYNDDVKLTSIFATAEQKTAPEVQATQTREKVETISLPPKVIKSTKPLETMKLTVDCSPVDAVIMDVTSLDQFAIQLGAEEVQLQLAAMMTELNQACEESTACDVEEGGYVATQFSDGISTLWYRGLVMQKLSDKLKVYFIDYGNTDLVSKDAVTSLDEKFMTLSAIAISCALKGCDEGALTQLKQLTNVAIKIEAVACEHDKHIVNIYSEGVNLTSSVSPPEQKKALIEVEATKISEKVDIVLLPPKVVNSTKPIETMRLTVDGSPVDAVIMDVTSLDQFAIQLGAEEVQLELAAMMSELNQACEESTACDVEEGGYVAAQFSDGISTLWYRGLVMQKLSDKLKVYFIDYGNTDLVSKDVVTSLDEKFMTLPAIAINCSLKGCESKDALSQLKQLTNVVVKVETLACEQEKHIVSIHNDDVKLTSIFATAEQKTAQEVQATQTREKVETILLPPKVFKSTKTLETMKLTVDGSPVDAVIMDVTSLDQFAIQLGTEEVQLELAAMMAELNQACVEATACDVEEGGYVAAQFSDGISTLWYRGLVMQKFGDKLKVYFIDYGNTDLVSKDAVTSLDEKFMTLPAIAINCSLKGCESKDALSQLKQLTNVVVKVETLACEQEKHIVSIHNDDVKLTSIFATAEQKTAQEVQATQTREKVETILLPPKVFKSTKTLETMKLTVDGSPVDAVIMDVTSLDQFAIQLGTEEVQLELAAMMAELNQACVEATACDVEEGGYVAAQFSDGISTLWYRGLVMQKFGDKLKVYFIDYGNTDLVSKDAVTSLDEKFMTLPAIAISCALKGSKREHAQAQLKQLTNMAVKLEALAFEQDKYIVNIYNEEIQLKSVICSEATAKNIVKTSARAGDVVTIRPTELDLDGSRLKSAPVFINSPASFYIQMTDDKKKEELTSMMKDLNEHCIQDMVSHHPVAGEFVAALFIVNGEATGWYRALVEEVRSDQHVRVFFVDYGNTEVVTVAAIRQLPKSFTTLQAFGVHCCLLGAETANEEAKSEMNVLMNHELFTEALRHDGDLYTVKLYLTDPDQTCVNTVLGLQLPAVNEPDQREASPQVAMETSTSTIRNAESVQQRACSPDSTTLVDSLPKPKSPPGDVLPQKKCSSPLAGERKPVFVGTLRKSRPTSKEFQAIVSSVVRPNLFHCQVFEDPSILQELKGLSDTMKVECEQETGADYSLEQGELCCAKFPEDDEWYRGMIQEVFPDKTAKVWYVDFGNEADVPVHLLRPASEHYTQLPLQAFRCSLHGVVPVDGTWTEAGKAKMSEFMSQPLKAKVIEEDKDIYGLELTTLSGENVRDTLIKAALGKSTDARGMDEKDLLMKRKELLEQLNMLDERLKSKDQN